MPAKRQIVIGVIGGSVCSTETYTRAEQVGRLIAESGCRLVCGGLGGVMEAASKGANEAGGEVIGILPGTDPSAANKYVTLAIPTGLSEARNALVVNTADVLIAMKGEYGTMSEIALALRSDKPVISLGEWKLSEKIVEAGTPEEAVELAVRLAREQ